MRGRTLFLLCLLLCSIAFAWGQQPGTPATPINTVGDLVRAGVANNKDLASVRLRITEAQGQKRQAGVGPAPALAINGVTGKPFGIEGEEQYGAQVSQQIEIFGKRSKRLRVAGFAVEIAEAEWQDRSNQLRYEIEASYAEVLSARQKLKVLKDLIGFNRESLRLTEERVREGDVAALEANLLRVEISRAEVLKRSAEGRLLSAELELRRLAGLDRAIPIPDAEFPPFGKVELQSLQLRALEQRPDFKVAKLREELEAAGVALAKAESHPDVTFSAGYSRQNSQFEGLNGITSNGALSPIRDRTDLLNFGLSIPLRSPRSNAGNLQAAEARTASARAQREYLQQAIPLEVESAYQRWLTAMESLETLRDGVMTPSQANLGVLREAYRLGQLRLLDVLNEQRRLVDTQLAFIDTQTDANRSWAELERATGESLP